MSKSQRDYFSVEIFSNMSDIQEFLDARKKQIDDLRALGQMNIDFMHKTLDCKYSYNFDWLGLPIIQLPQDIVALQEIIWSTKPDLIIETGVARGGSIIFHASMLRLLGNNGRVVGIDIDIRPHNREAIEKHPLSGNVTLIQGSSIDNVIVNQVKSLIKPSDKVMVILDSNHTHEHVLAELSLYHELVSKGCYLVVLDTVIEDIDYEYANRSWSKGNNPKTAVHEFIKKTDKFIIDTDIHNKLIFTVAPDGYLKCVK